MKIVVCMHGKPKDDRILGLIEDYSLKINRFQKLEFEFLKEFKGVEFLVEKFGSTNLFFLDEDGKNVDTGGFSAMYEKVLNQGDKQLVFCIGPAEGFGDIVSTKVKSISLSPLAMQHDLAALVLVEQIYRVVSIKNNLPYHRA